MLEKGRGKIANFFLNENVFSFYLFLVSSGESRDAEGSNVQYSRQYL